MKAKFNIAKIKIQMNLAIVLLTSTLIFFQNCSETLDSDLDSDQELRDNVNSIIEGIKDADPDIAQEATQRLIAVGPQAIPLVGNILQSADLPLRGELVFAMGHIGSQEALPFLHATLNDENSYIRRNAVEALGNIRSPQAAQYLIQALADEDPLVRAKASWALGQVNSPLATDALNQNLQNESDETVKLEIAETLGQLKDKGSVENLLSQLNSEDNSEYLQFKIVETLGTIGDSSALSSLKDLLTSLKSEEPVNSPSFHFVWEEKVKTLEEAIGKIELNINPQLPQ